MTPINWPIPIPDPSRPVDGRDPFLVAADRIGNNPDRDALWSGKRCNWVGWSMEPMGATAQAGYRALPPNLYTGVAGVALFLAYLWRWTGDRRHREVLSGAVEQLLSSHPTVDPATAGGVFTGLPGIAHALIRVGELTEEWELIQQGLRLLEQPTGGNGTGGMLDVVGGYAASIPVLIQAAQRYARPALFDAAKLQGEQLLLQSHQGDAGTSWPSPISRRNLTGFSHGTAGMAVALLECTTDGTIRASWRRAGAPCATSATRLTEPETIGRITGRIPSTRPASPRSRSLGATAPPASA